MASMIDLSTSTSLPSTVSSQRFPNLELRSRTTARKATEDSSDRLHTRLHDGFLQIARDLIEPRGDRVKRRVAIATSEL